MSTKGQYRYSGFGLFLLVVFQAVCFAQAAPSSSACCHALVVGPVVMTVSDMNRSVAFYSHVLTFKKVREVERSGPEFDALYGAHNVCVRAVDLQLGDETIELQKFTGRNGTPVPADAHSNDLDFQHVAIIVSDMDKAYEVLSRNHVDHISSYPQTLPSWNPDAAGIKAFYFKDPDGHPLEVLQLPRGKGDSKWQKTKGKLFLGIDHTAIAVSNTEKSLAFYQKLLGMRVAGESDNYGVEQEHLSHVSGAHVRITALRGSSGIGVELLQYLAPRDGKTALENASPTDIAHHETAIEVANLERLNSGLKAQLSSRDDQKGEIVTVPGLLFGARLAELIRDPDRHVLLLLQR